MKVPYLTWVLVVSLSALGLRPPATASSPLERGIAAQLSAAAAEKTTSAIRDMAQCLRPNTFPKLQDAVGFLGAWCTMPGQEAWLTGYWTQVMKEQAQSLLDLAEGGHYLESWEQLFHLLDTWYEARRVVEGCA